MKILKFLFVLCMFAVVSPAVAQQAVTGRILDAETGAPVVGATVRVERTLTGATADNRGEFRIADAAPDATIRAHRASCRAATSYHTEWGA